LIFDRLANMTFCGPARDTALSNQQTGKLNFDTNYITITIIFFTIATLSFLLEKII
jgi:hypothetical protein